MELQLGETCLQSSCSHGKFDGFEKYEGINQGGLFNTFLIMIETKLFYLTFEVKSLVLLTFNAS
jgi:hypothetical protein